MLVKKLNTISESNFIFDYSSNSNKRTITNYYAFLEWRFKALENITKQQKLHLISTNALISEKERNYFKIWRYKFVNCVFSIKKAEVVIVNS